MISIGNALLINGYHITTEEFINGFHKLNKSIIIKDEQLFYDAYVKFDISEKKLFVWITPRVKEIVTINTISLYKEWMREWIRSLYNIGIIDKKQANELYKEERSSISISYTDIYKKKCYDNADIKLDF